MKSKRILALMLALVMALSLAACGGSKQEETPADNAGNGGDSDGTLDFGGAELVVATWGWAEAGLKTLAADFESQYNCTIVVDPTSGNGDRLNKLMAEQNDPTADVALLTKSFAQTGNESGLFEKIDTSIVTSLGDLYDIAVNADGYGPCYSLCRYGIMYNADALEQAGLPAPTSYEDLFDDQYAHMVALPDMTSTAGPYMLVAMAEAMGGSQLSAYGLCHLGDYEATVFSRYSHNRQFGESFIRGETYTDLAEGYYTVEALVLLGERYGVELPICQAVHRILYCGADPMAELRTLLDRDLTREFGES